MFAGRDALSDTPPRRKTQGVSTRFAIQFATMKQRAQFDASRSNPFSNFAASHLGYHHDKWWFALFLKDAGTHGVIELMLPVAAKLGDRATVFDLDNPGETPRWPAGRSKLTAD